jgi:hypothetical protein
LQARLTWKCAGRAMRTYAVKIDRRSMGDRYTGVKGGPFRVTGER